MGTGFPWGVRITKIIFDEIVVLGSDFFHEFGVNVNVRSEALEIVYCLGIELDWPAAAVNKEGVFTGPVT